MTSTLPPLTNQLEIYSVRLIDLEQPDFRNDALAGVRANYFRSGGEEQRDKTELELDGKQLSLQYSMRGGEPLSWKITRSQQPFQTVKRSGSGYCVLTYSEDGIVYKRSYFNNDHIWLRTEYYKQDNGNEYLASITPVSVRDMTALRLERADDTGAKTVDLLYPSGHRDSDCAALLYGSTGMLWYSTSLLTEEQDNGDDQLTGGFSFTESDFETPSVEPLDVMNAAYLSAEDIAAATVNMEPEAEPESEPEPASEEEEADGEQSYSAYEIIQQILTEAQKDNKNLFGTVAAYSEEPGSQAEEAPEGASEEGQPAGDAKPEYVRGEPEEAVLELKTPGGAYSYYGELDENNQRIGRGRTTAPDGTVVYDGEYHDDKRSGFGVAYYKDGSPNYFGDWRAGKRSGRGVGFRQSDGTMHAGRWLDNAPDGIGARFGSDGSFYDVCRYEKGTRNGKSVSFDGDGNVVIKVWENGELISEQTITD